MSQLKPMRGSQVTFSFGMAEVEKPMAVCTAGLKDGVGDLEDVLVQRVGAGETLDSGLNGAGALAARADLDGRENRARRVAVLADGLESNAPFIERVRAEDAVDLRHGRMSLAREEID